MSSYSATIKDSSINAIARILLVPITFLTLPVLTNNLSIIDYGLWGLIFTTNNLTMPFTGLGLPSAFSRYAPSYNKEQFADGFSSLTFFKFLTTLILSVFVLLFSKSISNTFFEDKILLVNLLSLFILVCSFEPILTRSLRIKRKILIASIYNLWNGYGTFFLYIIFFLFSKNIETLFLVFILFKLINILILTYKMRDIISFKTFDFAIITKYFNYGKHTLVSSIGFWYINLSDRIIMTGLIGGFSLGVYTASYQIGTIPRIFSGIISYILLIALSKLFDQGKIQEVKVHLKESLSLFLSFSIIFCFGAILFSEDVLLVLTNKDIAERGSMTTIIVSFAHLFLGISTIFSYPFLLTKNVKFLSVIWIIALIINIILNFILIPILGIEGAAISTLISYFIVMCVSIFKSRSLLRFEIDISKLIKVFFIAILMVLTDVFLKLYNPEVQVFFRFVLSLLVISVLCLALNIFELNKLKKIIKYDK